MTTPALGSGRPCAHHRTLSRTSRLLGAGLLAAGLLASASAPALAAPSAMEPQDPTEITPSLLVPGMAAPAADVGLYASDTYFKDMRTLFNSDALGFGGTPTAPAGNEQKGEGRIQRMINRGLALLGTPYRWGGTTPESGFDCSGLVGYVYRTTLGIELPRISRDMANVGELIRDRDSLKQGDLVFFSRRGNRVDHVGIYLGEGQFLHSPRTGKDVEVTTLASGYWSHRFLKGRRIAATDIATAGNASEPAGEAAIAKAIDTGMAAPKAAGVQQ